MSFSNSFVLPIYTYNSTVAHHLFSLPSRWGQLKDLPKMGALALVQDGDSVLGELGLGNAVYSDLMKKLWILSGIYISLSWLGLSYFRPLFIATEVVI